MSMKTSWRTRILLAEDDGGVGDPASGADAPGEKDPAYFSQFRKENRERFGRLKGYKSLDDLADMALKGMDAKEPDYTGYLKLPTKESSKEELRAFMTTLGVPEGPDKYSIPKEEGRSEALDAVESTLREAAYRAGMTDSQTKAMWGVIHAVTDTAVQGYEAQQKEKVDGFDKRFTKLFDDVDPDKRDEAITESMGYFKTFLNDTGLTRVMKENGAIYDERMVKALADYQKEVRGEYAGGSHGPQGDDDERYGGYSKEFLEEFGRRR